MKTLNSQLTAVVVDLITEKQNITKLTTSILAILEQFENDEGPKHVVQSARDYGPKSTRKMTRKDAWDILFGSYKKSSVKDIANALGLSKGQVYSLKGGYTFKDITFDEFKPDDPESVE